MFWLCNLEQQTTFVCFTFHISEMVVVIVPALENGGEDQMR